MPTQRTGDLQTKCPDTEWWTAVRRRLRGVGPVVWVDPVAIAAMCDQATTHRRLTSAAPMTDRRRRRS